MKKLIKVVFGQTDGKLNVLDSNLSPTNTINAHSQVINRVIYVNWNILTASSDNTVKIWDINNNWSLYCTYIGHSGSVQALISISNVQIFSGSSNGQIRQWELNPNTFPHTIKVYSISGTCCGGVTFTSKRVFL